MGRCTLLFPALAILIFTSSTAAFGTTANQLCSGDPCRVTSNVTVTPNSELNFGNAALWIEGGTITTTAGTLRIWAREIVIGRNSGIRCKTGSSVELHSVTDVSIAAGSPGGWIDLVADYPGDATIFAGEDVSIAGEVRGNANDRSADGSSLTIHAGGNVSLTGIVRAASGFEGTGGALTTTSAGSTTLTGVIDLGGGDFDGGELTVSAVGPIAVSGSVNVNAGAGGAGGTVTLTSQSTVALGGVVTGAGSNWDGWAGDGGTLDVAADGGVTVTGDVTMKSAEPDATGGSIAFSTAGGFAQTGTLRANGNGGQSSGGSIDIYVSGDADFGPLDVSAGNGGGGAVTAVVGGLLVADAAITANGSMNNAFGGDIDLTGREIRVSSALQASGSIGRGHIGMEACTVRVTSSGRLETLGPASSNVVWASGEFTMAGSMLSGGSNQIQYKSTPPVISGTANPAPSITLNDALAPCPTPPPQPPACGNGAREQGEACDDANLLACDGCSAACNIEGCGNGVKECAEHCDLGIANGVAGSGCTLTCTAEPDPGGGLTPLIPSSTTGDTGCLLEWQVTNPGAPLISGFPSRTQRCEDGDPACDMDADNNGVCAFEVKGCMGVADARIPSCAATAVQQVQMERPNAAKLYWDPEDNANAASLASAFSATGVTIRKRIGTYYSGSVVSAGTCTAPFPFLVTHDPETTGERVIQWGATSTDGRVLKPSTLTLLCEPNAAVCGNGVLEDGEECDNAEDNGRPGATCDVECNEEIIPDVRIPGGGPKASDCFLEWAVALNDVVSVAYIPKPTQMCTDGDPLCDFDDVDGQCTFRVWGCVGGADYRIGCAQTAVESVLLDYPKSMSATNLVAFRSELNAAFKHIDFPPTRGQVCTARTEVVLPADARKKVPVIRATAFGPVGKDVDTLRLQCLPNE